MSPGFGLITGMWYRVEEQPLRCGIWFTGNSIAVMIGGLLAYGIAHIQNSLDTWKVRITKLGPQIGRSSDSCAHLLILFA